MERTICGLRAGSVVAGALLFCASAATIIGSVRWSESADRLAANQDLLSALSRVESTVTFAETAERGYILTADPGYMAEFAEAASKVAPSLFDLTALLKDLPGPGQNGNRLAALVGERIELLRQIVELRRTRKFAEAESVVRQGVGHQKMEAIRAAISGLATAGGARLDKARAEMQLIRSLTVSAAICCSVIALLILAFSARQSIGEEKLRVAAQRAAHRAERRFDEFMNHLPSLIFMQDAAGRLVYCNPAVERLWQFRFSDRRDKTDAELWPRETATSLREADLRVLAGQESGERVVRMPQPDGTVHQFLTVKFPFKLEEEVYVGGIAVDITEREKAAETLRASEEFNGSILQSSRDCIIVLDLEGRILFR